MLPDTAVAYCDSTIAFPLFCEYALASNHASRPRKNLLHKREALVAALLSEATEARTTRESGEPAEG